RKASPSRPFILGVTKPSQKDAPCPVAKPHQSNGQLKPSSLPSSKPQLFLRRNSASIAGKRVCTPTRKSSGKRSTCRASSAVLSRKRPSVSKLAATNRKSSSYAGNCATRRKRWLKLLPCWYCEKSSMRSGIRTATRTNDLKPRAPDHRQSDPASEP